MTQQEADIILEAIRKSSEHLLSYSPPSQKQGSNDIAIDNMIVKGKAADYYIPNDHDQKFIPGSFDAWLSKNLTIPLLFAHNENIRVGETIRIYTKEDGLYHKSRLYDSPEGRDMRRLMDAKCLDSFSILYTYLPKVNPEPDFGKRVIKEVLSIDEISIVSQPAAPGCIMEGVNKTTREIQLIDLEKRLNNFFKVGDKLECPAIKEKVLNDLKNVWHRRWNGETLC